jgi:glycosyltransferase involved in cell wall biosynthesis
MNILYLLFLLPFVPYCVQIVSWYLTWINTTDYTARKSSDLALSVIIPFKDEAPNLKDLILSLNKQTYSNWDLLLINDHSEDESLSVVEQALENFKHPYKIIHSSGKGKKAALLEGIKVAVNPVIITTDSDCTFNADWLSTMASYYQQHSPDLLIGPVAIRKEKGLLSRFQRIDFTALQMSGGAAALKQEAIMCNGANLVCSKEDYLKANIQPEIASGDDMFLLEWMKKENKKIHFLKSTKALVETKAIHSLQKFMQQRARWAAKASKYKDRQIILSGLYVALSNLTLILSFVLSFCQPELLKAFVFLIVTKGLIDYMLLKGGSKIYGLSVRLLEIIAWQLLYPLYAFSVLCYPLFFKLQWKSREI